MQTKTPLEKATSLYNQILRAETNLSTKLSPAYSEAVCQEFAFIYTHIHYLIQDLVALEKGASNV